MTKKEAKKLLKDYKDFLNKDHKGMYIKISDYSLDKYIKKQLTLTDVVVPKGTFYCWDGAVGEKVCDKQCIDCKNENEGKLQQ